MSTIKLFKGKKGFVGPIGDDLPSLIMIIMSLSLFFSGVVFCLNVYNQKISNMEILTGAMDISRVVTRTGLIVNLQDAYNDAEYIATSYGLRYEVKLLNSNEIYPNDNPCPETAYVFNFLVATGGDIDGAKLDTLSIRVCKG